MCPHTLVNVASLELVSQSVFPYYNEISGATNFAKRKHGKIRQTSWSCCSGDDNPADRALQELRAELLTRDSDKIA